METILKLMETKQNETIFTNAYKYITSNGNEFYDTCELIHYIIENNIEPLRVHENLIGMFEIALKYDSDIFDNDEIEPLKALIEKMKLCEKLDDDTNYHECEYCGNIAHGMDEDILCDECIMTFKHIRYSEL